MNFRGVRINRFWVTHTAVFMVVFPVYSVLIRTVSNWFDANYKSDWHKVVISVGMIVAISFLQAVQLKNHLVSFAIFNTFSVLGTIAGLVVGLNLFLFVAVWSHDAFTAAVYAALMAVPSFLIRSVCLGLFAGRLYVSALAERFKSTLVIHILLWQIFGYVSLYLLSISLTLETPTVKSIGLSVLAGLVVGLPISIYWNRILFLSVDE